MSALDPAVAHAIVERAARARKSDARWRVLRPIVFLALLAGTAYAARTLPSLRVDCGAPTGTAKAFLNTAYVAQESYAATEGHYTTNNGWGGAGAILRSDHAGYRAFIKVSGDDYRGNERRRFELYLVGTKGSAVAGDVWRMTSDRRLENVRNGCRW